MYNNQFGYNPYIPPFNNNFSQPLQQPAINAQSSAVNSAVTNRQVLNGKLVDSIEVVRSMDIPLDGSISYFPIADGSAIVTKQLQSDGTSKVIIFKPIEDKKEVIRYITPEELKKSLDSIDLSEIDDLKDEIKEIKSEIKKIKKGD